MSGVLVVLVDFERNNDRSGVEKICLLSKSGVMAGDFDEPVLSEYAGVMEGSRVAMWLIEIVVDGLFEGN
jgi:hypothetical protein